MSYEHSIQHHITLINFLHQSIFISGFCLCVFNNIIIPVIQFQNSRETCDFSFTNKPFNVIFLSLVPFFLYVLRLLQVTLSYIFFMESYTCLLIWKSHFHPLIKHYFSKYNLFYISHVSSLRHGVEVMCAA